MLAFGASLAGPPEPNGSLSSGSYSFYINATGDSSTLPPSSETFYPGNGGTSQPFTNPQNPQPVTQSYSSSAAPTASATPASGSAVTVPLTLSDNFNANGNTVGYQVSDPVGSTRTDDNRGYGMATDSSGDIFVASIYNGTSTAGQAAVTEFSNTGSVVSAFGSPKTGTEIFSVDSGKDTPTAMFFQGDGKILVAGNSTVYGWWVARLNADGSLDSGFGSNGVETNFQTSGGCRSVTEETDGSHPGYVVLAGYTVSGTHNYEQLIRFTSAGALDSGPTGFGSGGKLTLFNSGSWTQSYGNFIMQAEYALSGETNKLLLVGGQAFASGVGDFSLAGISTAGGVDDGLDTNFGTNSSGETTVNFGTSAISHPIHGTSGCCAASVDSDYSLVCWENGPPPAPWVIYGVGVTNFTGPNGFALDRYTQSGTLDTSWGYNGLTDAYQGAASAGSSNNSIAYAAALQGPSDHDSSDQILCAGTGVPGTTGHDFVVARFNLDGTLDSGFGPSGSSSGSTNTDLSYPGSNSYNFTTGA